MAIPINVSATKVTINKTGLTVNQGEYNINNCNFTFSQEYDGLIKRAIFYNLVGEKYLVEIQNNQCIIPEVVLSLPGTIYIGVYAYQDDLQNKLVLRYSPTPDNFTINAGSYSPKAAKVTAPETSLDLIARVNAIVAEVQQHLDNGDFNGVGIANIMFNDDIMVITLTNGVVIQSGSLLGPQGPKGDPGEKGDTPDISFEIQGHDLILIEND